MESSVSVLKVSFGLVRSVLTVLFLNISILPKKSVCFVLIRRYTIQLIRNVWTVLHLNLFSMERNALNVKITNFTIQVLKFVNHVLKLKYLT